MGTQPQKWEAIKELFEAALEVDPAGRVAFLAQTARDAEVRAEVERLLAEHDQAGEFLSSPIADGLGLRAQLAKRFSPGEMLAGRFRIIRFLAAGGMGEVYQAEDLELREEVAVKTIRLEILNQPNAVPQLKREVHLARKVTHPNVCRVFDMFRHSSADGVEGETVIVSMELLEGPTLAERLKQTGRLTREEALPLIRQMAAGLGAAHQAGIVHRDFKPGNVVLVGSAGKTRVVITDFGLAFRLDASNMASAFTSGQRVFGTPAYMAPEQIEGKQPTSASDLYALGLVIYEMTTGVRPFESDTPLSSAAKKLAESPIPPKKLEPSLSQEWQQTILRCLEREPEHRFRRAEDVIGALSGEEARSPRELRRRRLRALVLGCMLLVLTGVAAVRWKGWIGHSGDPLSKVAIRRSVAVLSFKNLSHRPESNWLSDALPDMLTTELAASEQIRTIPGESVARMKSRLALPEEDSFARDTLLKIRNNLSSDIVVLGSFLDLGGESGGGIRLDLRVQDVSSGEMLGQLSLTGTEAQIFDLVSRAGSQIRSQLGLNQLSESTLTSLRVGMPSSPESARLYSEGLAKLRRYDASGAADSLQKAIAADPDNPLIHSAMASVWSRLFFDSKGKNEIQKAFTLSQGLAREDRLTIEAKLHESKGERDDAVQIYKTLFTFYPDNVEYGVRLANAQVAAGKPKDALATVASLRSLPQPMPGDPRIDLAEGRAKYAMGDFKGDQVASERAAKIAAEIGAQDIVAIAHQNEGSDFARMGDYDRALAAFGEAKEFYLRSNNRGALSRVLISSSIVYQDRKDFVSAKNLLHQSLSIARDIGDTVGIASAKNNLGKVLLDEGDLAEAKVAFVEVLKSFEELDNKRAQTTVLNNLGYVLGLQGDLFGSIKIYRRSVALARQINDRHSVQFTLNNLGSQLREVGHLKESRAAYDESMSIAREIGAKPGVGYGFGGLGELLLAEGDLSGARKSIQEALNIGKELKDQGLMTDCSLILAVVSFEERRPAEAERLMREALENYRTQERPREQATTEIELIRVLLAQHKLPAARQELDQVEALIKRSPDEIGQVYVGMVAAQVHAANGQIAAAISELRKLVEKSQEMHCAACELESRLALGEVEMSSEQQEEGRSHLQMLQRDASGKGFILIARKAASAQAI